MPTLLQRLLRREFRDLSGLTISGSIPLNESLLNELLADALAGLAARDPSPQPSAGDTPADLAPLARLVKRAQVRIDANALTLDFELSVPADDARAQRSPAPAPRA
jgi:hypothetical protein